MRCWFLREDEINAYRKELFAKVCRTKLLLTLGTTSVTWRIDGIWGSQVRT